MARTPRKWTGARSPGGLKRVRSAARRHEVLGPRRATAKTLVRAALDVAGNPGDLDPQASLAEAMSALDRAAKTGAIHRNAAARRKSRLALKVNDLLAGTTIAVKGKTKSVGKAQAQKAAKARIAAGKADKAKGAQTAAGKARAALSKTTRAEAAAAATAPKPAAKATPAKAAAKPAAKPVAKKAPAAKAKAPAKPAAKAAAKPAAKAARQARGEEDRQELTRPGVIAQPRLIENAGGARLPPAFLLVQANPSGRCVEDHRVEDLLERRHVRGRRVGVLHGHEYPDLAVRLERVDGRGLAGRQPPPATLVRPGIGPHPDDEVVVAGRHVEARVERHHDLRGREAADRRVDRR